MVRGEEDLGAVGLGVAQELEGQLQLVVLVEAVAHGDALGLQEGVAHGAADEDGVGLAQEVADELDLFRDLGAAQHRHQRLQGVDHDPAHGLQLLLQQEARGDAVLLEVVHHAAHGGVGTVRRAEGVVHVGVGHPGQGLGEVLAVAGLALVEAEVLQEQDLAGLQGAGQLLHPLADHAARQGHIETLALEPGGYGRQAELRFEADALRTSQVGAQDHGGAVVHKILEGGQGLADAGRVLHHAVLHRGVQVRPQEGAVPLEVQVAQGAEGQHRQGRDPGQPQAAEILQAGAAAGGEVADAVLDPCLVGGRDAVAAAQEHEGPPVRGIGHLLGHRQGALGEGLHLEDAHGAVPQHRPGLADLQAVEGDGVGADVQAHGALGHGLAVDHGGLGAGGHLLGHHVVDGQAQDRALLPGLGEEVPGQVELVVLVEAVAHGDALGLEEGEAHGAADEDGLRMTDEVADEPDLLRDLGAADHGHQRPLGVVRDAGHGLEFLHQQEPGGDAVRVEEGHHAAHRGVGTVGGAEGVVDVGVRQAGQGQGELLPVPHLAAVVTQVLQHQDLAGLEGGGFGLHLLAHDAAGHADVEALRLQPGADRGQAVGRLDAFALGAAQVRGQHHAGAIVQEVLQGGQGLTDPPGVLDLAVVDRHVQVRPEEDPVAFHIQILEGPERHHLPPERAVPILADYGRSVSH